MSTPPLSSAAGAAPPQTLGESLGLLWQAFLVMLERAWDAVSYPLIATLAAAVLIYGLYEVLVPSKRDGERRGH